MAQTKFVVFLLRLRPGELCSRLTHITDGKGKELRSWLGEYPSVFSWKGAELALANIVKHTTDTGEARPIRQPPRRVPYPLLEDLNRLVEEMTKNEVIKLSTSPA